MLTRWLIVGALLLASTAGAREIEWQGSRYTYHRKDVLFDDFVGPPAATVRGRVSVTAEDARGITDWPPNAVSAYQIRGNWGIPMGKGLVVVRGGIRPLFANWVAAVAATAGLDTWAGPDRAIDDDELPGHVEVLVDEFWQDGEWAPFVGSTEWVTLNLRLVVYAPGSRRPSIERPLRGAEQTRFRPGLDPFEQALEAATPKLRELLSDPEIQRVLLGEAEPPPSPRDLPPLRPRKEGPVDITVARVVQGDGTEWIGQLLASSKTRWCLATDEGEQLLRILGNVKGYEWTVPVVDPTGGDWLIAKTDDGETIGGQQLPGLPWSIVGADGPLTLDPKTISHELRGPIRPAAPDGPCQQLADTEAGPARGVP